MESSGKFQRIFLNVLKEDMEAGAGGALGDPDVPYAEDDARLPFQVGKVQTRKGSTGKKKKREKKKKKKVYLPGENEEDVHKPVKPGILKKRLGELSCSKVRGAKGKLKDKGTHYAKALQRYLNYHC